MGLNMKLGDPLVLQIFFYLNAKLGFGRLWEIQKTFKIDF